jgi:disulfide bond formation protein DsbB
MNHLKNPKIIVHSFNMLELLGIQFTLILALGFQLFLHELPCPLCLLQRIGFFGVTCGLLMNLRFGLHPSHYAIALISALFTSFVALRQIALHVVPGTGHYGEAFLGLHLYTWSFIVSMIILVVTSLILGIDRQYQNHMIDKMRSHWITKSFIIVAAALILINIILLFLQCGFGDCPENPVSYKLFGFYEKFYSALM